MDAFGFTVATSTKADADRRASTLGDVEAVGKPATSTLPHGTSKQSIDSRAASDRYYNPVVMSFIRDDWIQQQLHLRQSEYTVYQKTHIVTGTWNVNAKKPIPPSEGAKLMQWLQQQTQNSSPRRLPDIVALGFQEIVDLNAVNVVVSNQSGQRSSQWEEALLATLNQSLSQNEYKLLLSKNLVGILLVVFVRADHVDYVREVHGATAGVGIMGMMGNKGGAAVRLSFYDSTLCFVCAHLAAHRENVTGRNADYANILSKIDFKDNDESLTSDMRFYSGEPPILNHDFVFWIGDLNYRISDDITTEECFHYAENGQLSKLLAREQLIGERKRGNVFQGFEEGPISFAPTYKFQAGTSVYEKRPEKKLRAPAWCDRILWRAKIPGHVSLLHYDSVMALEISDHKPVHAFFDVQIKHQVDTKKNQVLREIMMQLDKWENENMPRVRLLQGNGQQDPNHQPSSGVVTFPHVKYGLEQTRSIFIENTGVVVAHFRFIPKLEEVTICKPWLRVSPVFGMIPPKEKVEIRVTARVDETTARGLTSGDETLDDTMILRIENGRDYFLVVSGQYDASCFGCSLEQLVSIVTPVRSSKLPVAASTSVFHIDQPHDHPQQSDENQGVQRIPKELWRMVNDIFQNFLNEKNLFVEAGSKQELVVLREALDTGSPFIPHSGYSMAELLLAWLQSLRESVVPDDVLATALANGNGNVAQTCRELMNTLPPVRHNVLIYLIAFIKEVLKHSQANKLTPDKLAFVFSRCIVTQYKPEQRTHSDDLSQSPPRENNITSPPLSNASIGSFASTAPSSYTSSTSPPNPLNLPPEDRLRQTAREAEVAQWNAAQRTEKMEKMLFHWLTTNSF
ncbi:hypothetical protein Poli38472_007692 [Pythium oligandrum]|uniref:Rho-GAP domain-containing protein n=2 Tax=Pythium oligandrum TaxID=41045 RepID=A0A8K1CR49_PYTOL|nr:hypothetical protein Poli38472_007692 [Pythium oligandrum]|eukprot:TMW68020.1 hypothetical protein Poli38472_007692 [Pythium oligandrum]